MKQELILRRALAQRLLPRQQPRIFVHNIYQAAGSRPQLPFLMVPIQRENVRSFTTKKRRWFVEEVKLFVRYSVGLWGLLTCAIVASLLIREEMKERDYPTPREWSYYSRYRLRSAKHTAEMTGGPPTDWAQLLLFLNGLIKRLQDEKIDGKGLKEAVDGGDGGFLVEDVGKIGYDVTGMSENWRRGYYQSMMLAALAAEHTDGYMLDKTRKVIFRPEVVLGPSNPNPQPVPFGAPYSAPFEEDCVLAFEPADNYYLRILTTNGFTAKQKMDAALSYALFLNFKQRPEAAEPMFKWALSLATRGLGQDQGTPQGPPPYDPETFILNEEAGPPSANVLTALTEFAIFKTSKGNVADALPMFISLYKARKGLSDTPPADHTSGRPPRTLWETIMYYAKEPPYPDPPPDGTSPPWRSPQEICKEGALNLYIGELLFTSRDSERERGVGWTCRAVDMAEEQLRGLQEAGVTSPAEQKACRQCLKEGIRNWKIMAATMAKREAEREETEKKTPTSLWLFWKRPWFGAAEVPGRWKAELKEAEERETKTAGLVEELKKDEESLLMQLLKA